MSSLYKQSLVDQIPHVRLLTLLPADSEADPVCCTITTFELTAAPAFESLSYCWGDATQKELIECNETPFPVTKNLYSALHHLRYPDKDRMLWTDAICINQEDDKERSAQVVLMRDIYRRAERVLVWLGPSADDTELAYSTLRRLGQYWPEILERWALNPMSALKLGPYRKTLQRLCGLPELPQSVDIEIDARFQLTPREIAALRGLLERPWWMRLWIVQEVCVANAVTMICGFHSMSWNEFSCSYVVAMGAGGMITSIGSPLWLACCIGLYEMKSAFERMQQQKISSVATPADSISLRGFFHTIDMRRMTRMTRHFQASDPRDKIYGLVGLVKLHPDEEGLSIVPNYALSVVECYQDAALTIMKQSNSLRVLEDVVWLSTTKRRLEDLPSWVPDWSYDASTTWEGASWGPASPFAKHAAIAMMSDAMARNKYKFSACPETEQCQPKVVDRSVLVLEGYVVDIVASTGHMLHGALKHENEATWKLYSEEKIDRSLLQRFRLFVNTCLRVSVFVSAVLSWEDLAFADPVHRTKCEEAVFHEVKQEGNYTRDLETSIQIYEKNWRLLLTWLRRFAFLQVFGRGVGILTLYNLVIGVVSYISFLRSRSKSHMVTLTDSMGGNQLARTTGGRLANVACTAQVGDSIALLRGGKYAFVIRPKGHRWEVIGPAYVAGIMNGEAWQPGALKEMEFI